MSVITSHILSFAAPREVSLEQLLRANNLIQDEVDRVIPGGRNDSYSSVTRHCKMMLNLLKADNAACQEELKFFLDKGVRIGIPLLYEDQSKEALIQAGFTRLDDTVEHGYVRYMRPYTKDEQDYILCESISSYDDGEQISWIRNYGSTDTPAFLISCIFPDIQFDYKEVMECEDLVCHVTLQNGKVIHDYFKEAAEREDAEREQTNA